MSCQEIEKRILDYQETQMSPAGRQAVEIHLAGCAHCRAFKHGLRELDAALLHGIKSPTLSSDFDQRLQERIQARPMVLSAAQRAERKRQLQAEFEVGMVRFARAEFALHRLLNRLSRPLMVALTGCFIWWLTLKLVLILGNLGLGERGQNLLSCWLVSAVFLTIGLVEAFPLVRKNRGLS